MTGKVNGLAATPGANEANSKEAKQPTDNTSAPATAIKTTALAAIDRDLAEHVEAIRSLRKRVVADIIEIGRRLTDCKEMVGHGGWLSWLESELGWSEQTARNFMQVHKLAGTQAPNFGDLALPISSLYLLAAPSIPSEVRDEVIAEAQAGRKVKHGDVARRVAQAKPTQTPPRRSRSSTPKNPPKATLTTGAEIAVTGGKPDLHVGNSAGAADHQVGLDEVADRGAENPAQKAVSRGGEVPIHASELDPGTSVPPTPNPAPEAAGEHGTPPAEPTPVADPVKSKSTPIADAASSAGVVFGMVKLVGLSLNAATRGTALGVDEFAAILDLGVALKMFSDELQELIDDADQQVIEQATERAKLWSNS